MPSIEKSSKKDVRKSEETSFHIDVSYIREQQLN